MDLKAPPEWLEFPEDAEVGETVTLNAEEFPPEALDDQPLDEDFVWNETDSGDEAAVMSGETFDDTEIVMIEFVVPPVQRNPLEPERRNRHRRNGRSRRSRRLWRLRRSRRFRDRQRRSPEHQQDSQEEVQLYARVNTMQYRQPTPPRTTPDNEESYSQRRRSYSRTTPDNEESYSQRRYGSL
uniref:Uncharacterized protein n=1 Tax=Anopheles minimus TaxID=112268 RepID=A0A182VS36_9DIPT